MSKPLSEYVKEAKDKRSDLAEVMEKRRKMKIDELDDLQIEALIQEQKARLGQYSPSTIPHGQASNFATMLFAGRPPSEIQEIINGLTPEGIDKLALIAAKMNPSNFANFRELIKEPGTEAKTIIEALKTGMEISKGQNTGPDYKAIAEILKVGVELGKAQNPAQSQQDQLQLYKVISDSTKPLQDALLNRDKQIAELQLEAVKAQIPPPLTTQLEHVKQLADAMGYGKGGVTEVSLKLEEMKQNHDIGMKKIDLEEQRWRYEKEHEGDTLNTVKDIVKTVTEGPVGKAIESIGGGTADRIRGGKGNSTSLVKAQCPKCGGVFGVNPALPIVTCVHCGEQLSRTQPNPQQIQTPPAVAPQESSQTNQQESQANVQSAQSTEQQPAP